MSEKLNPTYKLPTTEVPINIKAESEKIFQSNNKALSDACQRELKQLNPWKLLIPMADAIFRSAS